MVQIHPPQLEETKARLDVTASGRAFVYPSRARCVDSLCRFRTIQRSISPGETPMPGVAFPDQVGDSTSESFGGFSTRRVRIGHSTEYPSVPLRTSGAGRASPFLSGGSDRPTPPPYSTNPASDAENKPLRGSSGRGRPMCYRYRDCASLPLLGLGWRLASAA